MKLNALLKTLGFLALAATPVVAGTAPAPKNPIAPAPVNDDLGINASLGYDTSYLWRGINFGSNWLRAGLNGSVLLVGGASEDGAGSTSFDWAASWGFLMGDNDSFTPNFGGAFTHQSFQRIILDGAFSHDFGPAKISLGYRYYYNTGDLGSGRLFNGFGASGLGMQNTQEVYVGVSTSVGPIDLASSANYDWISDGWYFDATASSTIAITDAISVVPSVNIGYAKNYTWGFTPDSANIARGGAPSNFGGGAPDDVTGFVATTFQVAVPIKLNSRATLTPYIAYKLAMNGSNNVAQGSRSIGLPDTPYENHVYGGVSLNIRF